MKTCRAVEVLARLVPIRAWKGDILQHHLDRCPACQAHLAGREEARDYVPRSDEACSPDPIWPAVETRIRMKPQARGRRVDLLGRLWKPITGITAVAVALLLIFIESRPPRPAGTALPAVPIEDFRLDSVEAWGKPAQALIYQARDSQITIIWVR
jgi:hypothetical protein